MKRTKTVSFKLNAKRKCGLPLDNCTRKKCGSLALFDEVEHDHDKCSPLLYETSNNLAIEDTTSICKRLKAEGNFLAENARYWEAISKFTRAIDLHLEKLNSTGPASGSDLMLSVLHELCSQCYTELGEVYPAVASAEKAISYNKLCPLALQTLARAQINIGELYLAKGNIQRSLHVNPSCAESWNDLRHTVALIQKLNSSSWSKLPTKTRPGIVCQR